MSRPPSKRSIHLPRAAPLVAILASLIAAGPALGSTTVGSGSLGSSGSLNLDCNPKPCVTIQDQIDGSFVSPPNGVITSWSVRNAAGTIALRVLRPDGGLVANELHATNVSESADETGSGTDSVQTFDARQAVRDGDYFGVTLVTGSTIGAFNGDGDDDLYDVPGDLGLTDVEDTNGPDQFEQLLQVEVEPDADSDGYGDETQDGCPSSAASHGACPSKPKPVTPKPPTVIPPVVDLFAEVKKSGPKTRLATRSVRASKKGGIALVVTNGSRVSIKGKLALAAKKLKKAGSKSFSAAAAGSVTVKIKLSRKARKALKRRRKLKLTVTIKAKATQGKASKKRFKLTVKPAKKKKKRQKRKPTKEGVLWNADNLDSTSPQLDFTFSLRSGQITIEKTTDVRVTCYELGGGHKFVSSLELFYAKGPFALGGETTIKEKQEAGNTLVSGGKREISYAMKSQRSGDKITGELKISFTGYTLNFNPGQSGYFTSCKGTAKFEAVNAG